MNSLFDSLSQFIGDRPGLLPLLGILLIVLNFVVQFLPLGWFSEADVLLHLGLVLSILGFLLIRVLN